MHPLVLYHTRCLRCAAPLLDLAIREGRIEAVHFLLASKADPNCADARGDTPLHWAIGLTRNEVSDDVRLRLVEMLIQAGAKVNAPVRHYLNTPLHAASSYGGSNLVKFLIAAGGDVNATNEIGQTPLHRAEDPETARLLIAAGANPKVVDQNGETPVDVATRRKKTNLKQVIEGAPAK